MTWQNCAEAHDLTKCAREGRARESGTLVLVAAAARATGSSEAGRRCTATTENFTITV